MTPEELQAYINDPNTPKTVRDALMLAMQLGMSQAQQQAQPAFDPTSITMGQAQNNLQQFNDLQDELNQYQSQLMSVAAPRIREREAEIDEQYADMLENAMDVESRAQVQSTIDAEKTQAREEIIGTLRPALDQRRQSEGMKSLAQLQSGIEQLAPIAQKAQQKLATFQTGDPRRPSTQGLGQAESAEKALAEQRLRKEQANLNFLKEMEQAENDPAAMEQFISKVESIGSPQLQDERIQMLSRLGFEAPRPIKLAQGGSVQPSTSMTGGGFATMPDGSVKVYLPDGQTQTVGSESEAQSILDGFVDVDSVSANNERKAGRAQLMTQLQNNISSDQQRLAAFTGGVQPVQTQPLSNFSATATNGNIEKDASVVSRPEQMLSLPGALYGAGKGLSWLDKVAGNVSKATESFVTGKPPSQETIRPFSDLAKRAKEDPNQVPSVPNMGSRSTVWGGMF